MSEHKIITGNSSALAGVDSQSVNLIVTSPPYPMIEMWDKIFSNQDPLIEKALSEGNGKEAFTRMHDILNSVWKECDRVLSDNGFVCINIGDATRSINGNFELFSNHTMIINYFLSMGYSVMPDIHWRKPSNAPNKFMGSGMYPAGAYVTYEHEYILIFRKGGKREFKGTAKDARQKSAFFWEERNIWFSDLWEIKGTAQNIKSSKADRSRNASYPLEIPLRLVYMYSAMGDTVLDPFAGLGTTSLACMLSDRNSIGVDIDPEIACLALDSINVPVSVLNELIAARVKRHLDFIDSLPADKKEKCYINEPHGFKVKTRQETAIEIQEIESIQKAGNVVTCTYKKYDEQTKPKQLSMLD